MINVLVFTFLGGSHYKNAKEMANWLTTVKREDGNHKFNVTVFAYADNMEFTEKDNLHVLRHRVDGMHFIDISKTEMVEMDDLFAILAKFEAMGVAVCSLLGEHYDLL